jgi:hypothetical protein
LKYLETAVTSRSEVYDELRQRINTGNAYYSVRKLLSSHLLSETLKISRTIYAKKSKK